MTAAAIGVPGPRPAPWSPAARWGVRGWVTDLGGPVHWVEFGEAADREAPPIVFVHGLGGSHLNWVLIGPALATGRRAVAVDLPGFGLSPGIGRDSSVPANAAVLRDFLATAVGKPAVLVGNSMGATVSLLAAQSAPAAVAGLVLVDPALPIPAQRPDARVAAAFLLYIAPVVGELVLRGLASRQSARQTVERVINMCFADPSRASEAVLEASTELAEHRRYMAGTERSLVIAARSLMRLLSRPGVYRAVISAVRVPTLLVHGEADRLVPIASARRALADRPDWAHTFLPGVGHTPQLETPDDVIGAVSGWLAS
ncbi:MAG: alpha/beta fold hydrolase, partial [Acidimicrobiales bacterium]